MVKNANLTMAKGLLVIQIREHERKLALFLNTLASCIGSFSGVSKWTETIASMSILFTGTCQAITPAQET